MATEEVLEQLLRGTLTASQAAPLSGDDPTEELETVDPDHPAPASVGRRDLKPLNRRNLLAHPDAHPVAVDLVLLRGFGPEWLGWEPETVAARAAELGYGELSPANYAKAQACKALHLVDTFWQRWEVFAWCADALHGHAISPEVMPELTAAQCTIAVDVANQIRDDVPWSDEVKAFLAQLFRFEGVFCPLPPCDFVPIDDDGYAVDRAAVLAAWPAVRQGGQPPKVESVESEQLRRMLLIQRELDDHRARFRAQMPWVMNA